MEAALRNMFQDMNAAFAKRGRLDFGNDSQSGSVTSFLRRFDAIFTLNQDTLLERHYLNNVAVLAVDRHWQGHVFREWKEWETLAIRGACVWQPAPHIREIPYGFQPYLKLHGSSN
jgi:hypothetical protein